MLNIPLARIVPGSTQASADILRTICATLEGAGIAGGLMSEHPAPSAEWLRTDPAAHDSLDPLMALACLAGYSTTLKLLTNVVVLPYRNPFLTAKAAATLQILSDNRLILGVGTGYQKEEFDALGADFVRRGAVTDEAIETIRLAWGGGEVVKKGLHFDAVGNEPRPLPSPPPPIWVGGGSDRAVTRAARWGDGWSPYFTMPTNDPTVRRSALVSMEHFSEKLGRLHEQRAAFGRSGPFDVAAAPPFRPQGASAANAQRFLDEVGELVERGATVIWTTLPAHSVEEYLEVARWFGEEVVGKYAS